MVTIRPTKAFCLKVLQLEHTGTRDTQGCHKRQIVHPSWGSRRFAAVASEVMTNTLGFLEFYKSARWKEAGLAACDLDTPYILVTQGRQILADADCPDFAALQMRQAVWRSVPLAIVGFFLACRPFCGGPGVPGRAIALNDCQQYGWRDGRQQLVASESKARFQERGAASAVSYSV